MEKLNELAELAQAMMNAETRKEAFSIGEEFTLAASTNAILAIAEAFRALEQRAEAAEAKLAEMQRQEPVAYRWEGKKSGSICYDGIMPLGIICQPLFIRPAPAINLAELVPDAERIHNEFDDWREGWNACRAAILRKIEEAK
ncbi:hypothetical protein EKL29_07985 [Pantoea sp. YU22]|uniref:hypothetical protein n=1 Tax=Pantoea sp. YU22 TaxID=2497684 RepID=UPI000F88FDF7|nr:hypothetical protein [Pantoea sp. YU22]RTY58762.1 hypothetical protein EKL29_07985 [Pantoea sp. YU22]